MKLHAPQLSRLTGLCVALAALNPGAAPGAEAEVLARVNGEPVHRAELARMKAHPLTRARMAEENRGDDQEAVDRVAVRELIRRRLLLQEATRRKLTVSSSEVDQGVAALRRRFADLASFARWLGEHGLNEETLFEAVREEVLVARTTEELVSKERLTEAEVRQYFEAHQSELAAGEEVRLRVMVVKHKVEADAIMEVLKAGGSFPQLAQARSHGLRARQGGDTGWVLPQQLPPLLRDNVRTLEVGTARGPLRRGEELLIIRLEGRRTGRPLSLEEARSTIEQRLRAQKQQAFLVTWLDQQEQRSRIEWSGDSGRPAEGVLGRKR